MIIKASQWLRNQTQIKIDEGVWHARHGGLRGACFFFFFFFFVMPLSQAHMTENVKAVLTKETKFSWNSWQIDLSTATLIMFL